MKTVYLIFMSLSVFILTSVLLIKQNTNLVLGQSADFNTVSVNVDKTEAENLMQKINSSLSSQIEKIRLISAQDQLNDVQSALPSYSQGLFDDAEIAQILNPIIEIELTSAANNQEVINQIRSFPGVNEASFSNDWAEKIKNLFNTLNLILNTVFLLFFIILSFLIAILIRTYLIDSKDYISLQALLGATPKQALVKQYTSILKRTLIAYAIGLAFATLLGFAIKNKLSFVSQRLTFLDSTNTAIILVGLVLNLWVSYLLSYYYVKREYYSND